MVIKVLHPTTTLWSWLLVLLSSSTTTMVYGKSGGKGPRGLQVLSSRYVLVCEANLDALLVVNVREGGVEGTIRLHSKEHDPTSKEEGKVAPFHADQHLIPHVNQEPWLNPNYVATCLDCDFLYVVGSHHINGNHRLHHIKLPKTWSQMIHSHDFSSLAEVDHKNITHLEAVEPLDGIPGKIIMTKDGKKAYFTDPVMGVWEIDQGTQSASTFMHRHQMGTKGPLEGCYLTPDEQFLVVTSYEGEMVRIQISDKKIVDADLLFFDMACVEHNQKFHSWAVSKDGKYGYAFFSSSEEVLEHVNHGWALYRLSLSTEEVPSLEAFVDHSEIKSTKWCQKIAGNEKDAPGWIDGHGQDTRFTRPHSVAVLEENDDHSEIKLVATDVDNRAVRLIDIKKRAQVFTVEYNDGLWEDMYFGGKGEDDDTKSEMFLLNSNLHNHNRHDMDKECKAVNAKARSCHAHEIRDKYEGFLSLLDEDQRQLLGNFKVWTETSCSSCWINDPGYCPSHTELVHARGKDDVDNTKNERESFWGSQYYMTAHVQNHAVHGSTFSMHTQCVQQDNKMDQALALCCVGEEYFENPLYDEGEAALDVGIIFLSVAGALFGLCGIFFVFRRFCQDSDKTTRRQIESMYFDDDRTHKRWRKRQTRNDTLKNIHGRLGDEDDDDKKDHSSSSTMTDGSASSKNGSLTMDDFLELFVDEDLDRRTRAKRKNKKDDVSSTNSATSTRRGGGSGPGGSVGGGGAQFNSNLV